MTPDRLPLALSLCALLALGAAGCRTGGNDAPAAEGSAAAPMADDAAPAERIIALSGGVTETVFALGYGDAVVGVDASSVYPAATAELPRLGYHRRLSAEGVLSLAPTMVIGTESDGPPEVIAQLEAAGVRYVRIDDATTVDDGAARVRAVASALGDEEAAGPLVAQIEAQLAGVDAALASVPERPRVVFVYARGHGALYIAGAQTHAGSLVERAGGINAVEAFTDFETLTPEALVAAAPDVIVVPERGLESVGGIDAFLAVPGVAQTPAGMQGRIVTIDDNLALGFGPRTGLAVATLAGLLHPDLDVAATEEADPGTSG